MKDKWIYISLTLMFIWVLWTAIILEMERGEWKNEQEENRKLLKELRDLKSKADSLSIAIEISEFTQALLGAHLEMRPPELFTSAGENVKR